ncbi:MAG TPA: hypothetical protein DCY20_02135, partial [Firmicutes bacterium]|nr:hypothetical protein [Bacillota bacterium]
YRYCNFTNSELFYFISTLSPLELVIFYTIFAIALTMNLNLRERTILGALFVDVGFTINTMVQQEAFQANFTKDAQANKDRVAYLARQNNMAADIELLKQKLEALTGTKITLPTETSTATTQNQSSSSQAESEAIANEDIGAISAEEASTADLSTSTSSLF